MSKSISKKILIVLAIIGIISVVFSTSIFATDPINTDIWGQGSNFIKQGQSESKINHTDVWKELKPIASILMGIGLVVLVSVGSILGVKYMMAGADDKAKVKQRLIWFCVAAALIVGATGVFNIVVDVASQLQ